jgi:hypothetical protein
MEPNPSQGPEQDLPPHKDARAERTYALVVKLSWAALWAFLLLLLYLAYGPDFWKQLLE